MRAADRAQLVGMLARVGGRPADDLTDLGLAVTVQHDDAELVGEAARLQRRERRGDAAHVAQRREVDDRRRRRTASPSPRAAAPSTGSRTGATSSANTRGIEAVHHDDLGAGAQPEQHVVDAGVQRERHRHEVRRRARSGAAVAPAPVAPRSGREHPVEQLEVVRRGCAGPAWASPVVPDVHVTNATSGS